MAGTADLERTYSTIDFIFRRSIGETGDYRVAVHIHNRSIGSRGAQESPVVAYCGYAIAINGNGRRVRS